MRFELLENRCLLSVTQVSDNREILVEELAFIDENIVVRMPHGFDGELYRSGQAEASVSGYAYGYCTGNLAISVRADLGILFSEASIGFKGNCLTDLTLTVRASGTADTLFNNGSYFGTTTNISTVASTLRLATTGSLDITLSGAARVASGLNSSGNPGFPLSNANVNGYLELAQAEVNIEIEAAKGFVTGTAFSECRQSFSDNWSSGVDRATNSSKFNFAGPALSVAGVVTSELLDLSVTFNQPFASVNGDRASALTHFNTSNSGSSEVHESLRLHGVPAYRNSWLYGDFTANPQGIEIDEINRDALVDQALAAFGAVSF